MAFTGPDPWSLDGMSRLRRAIEITLPAKDLGSVNVSRIERSITPGGRKLRS